MNTLNVIAAGAVSAALGGVVVMSWRRADDLVISLLRSDAVCREAEADE